MAAGGIYRELVRVASRCAPSQQAEDIVQDVLLAAVANGRDPADPALLPWLRGAVRRHAAFVSRSAGRRKRRDGAWFDMSPAAAAGEEGPTDDLPPLPSAQRAVLALALAGHGRREIASLLRISDAALRQRLGALRRAIRNAGTAMPKAFALRTGHLRHGLLRQALLPLVRGRADGFASHDPDGHLFLVVAASPASQFGRSRQQGASQPSKETLK
ncbi:MAG: sigma-70 family RNA polymerase sigma factor [Bauldia sp.]|nr:sigma-70 family RNA polymerase sigma factor [Bauldia sp.]